jgi:pSer/pThr/pTyr-binding forkhead associated (FHA) protein
MQIFGTLVVELPSGEEQSFDLAKGAVSIGRGLDNDIVLSDSRASRSHARLECGVSGCYLVDLGSANGSYLNSGRVERAGLSSGDRIRVGDTNLRFESQAQDYTPDVTMIDNMEDLELTFARETVSMTLYDTTYARVVVNMPGKTWEVPLSEERTTIGRSPDCQIVLDHPKVSRHHAQIEMHGSSLTVRDLGSRNGTWVGSQAVEEHVLQEGDTIRIGDARLVYKAPYTLDDLTRSFGPGSGSSQPRLPVVFVPGFMGSELWADGERIWPTVRLFTHPEILALPDKVLIEPRSILNELVIVPNLIKQEQYNRLGDFLVESLGYQRGVDLFEFAYDWRQDVRDSARRLAQMVETWKIQAPFVIMAHSLGSLVSRYYVERLGGKSLVKKVIFMGGPHYGVPKAVANLIVKVDLLPFGLLGDRLRRVLTTFPSTYQILPTYDCVFDQNGDAIPVLEDEAWVEEERRHLLRMARQFRQELGNQLSVPSTSIFGYGIKTVNRVNVQLGRDRSWDKVDLVNELSGDNTIPDASTILAGSEIHPVQQYHGSLFVDNDVRMRLRLELAGRMR